MDQRDKRVGTDAGERKELSKEELDAMPVLGVIEYYEVLVKDLKTRTVISTQFLSKREARTVEQRGNVNKSREKLMAEKTADIAKLKAYIEARMVTSL